MKGTCRRCLISSDSKDGTCSICGSKNFAVGHLFEAKPSLQTLKDAYATAKNEGLSDERLKNLRAIIEKYEKEDEIKGK